VYLVWLSALQKSNDFWMLSDVSRVVYFLIIDCMFQVLKLKVDLIGHLALNSAFSKRSAEYCLTDLVDKIGDAKNGSAVQEALSCIAEATSLDFVALQVRFQTTD
jgi:hypothetical protein